MCLNFVTSEPYKHFNAKYFPNYGMLRFSCKRCAFNLAVFEMFFELPN